MRAGELKFFSDEQLRAMLRSVEPSKRREVEAELSWRSHARQHSSNPARVPEYVPGWILAATVRERRR